MTAAEQIQNAPALLPEITQDQWPAIYEGGDYLTNFIDRVRGEVTAEVPDLTTKKGRARVASLAAQVSSSKKAVESPGRDYLRVIKAKVKPIEENLREFVQKMDALRDEVRQPLTEWEEKEKARVDGHQKRIEHIRTCADQGIHYMDSGSLKKLISNMAEIEIGPHWEEFEGEAAAALVITQKTLRDALARREAFEAEQAALEKQRQEQEAERQRLERERLEREAEERARVAAEAKAKAEQEAAQRREIEARMAQERAEREAEAAKQREAQAKADAAAQAEREAEAAKQREAQAKADAAAQAERAAQAAAEAERKRIADEQAAADAEKAAREADQEHRATINREALTDLMAADLDEATAKRALIAIITGRVRHVGIRY